MATSVANLVRYNLILLLTLLMVIGCSSPSAVPTPRDRSISGTIHAPEGEDVEGTVLFACYALELGYCDEERSRNTTITQSGSSAPYAFTNLAVGAYDMFAFKDITGLPELAPGDFYGEYPELVSPPAQNVDIQLVILSYRPSGAEASTLGGIPRYLQEKK